MFVASGGGKREKRRKIKRKVDESEENGGFIIQRKKGRYWKICYSWREGKNKEGIKIRGERKKWKS